MKHSSGIICSNTEYSYVLTKQSPAGISTLDYSSRLLVVLVGLAFVLGASALTGARHSGSTGSTLQDLRDFLNAKGPIFIYKESLPQYDYYELSNKEIEEGNLDEKCTQYEPKQQGDDCYSLELKYQLDSAWKNKTIYATLGENRQGKRPYMNESAEKGGNGTQYFLVTYDRHNGCALFKYVYSTNGFNCEIHVLGHKVQSYHKLTNDTCRQRVSEMCHGDLQTTYDDSCGPSK
uniref:Putative salivary lipocalin n=1 Tax=Rhipicephalus pulchellus TaxID=72859 RepID=L7LQX5_RHIPC